MSWIKTISYEESSGRLRALYDRVKGPGNTIDNVLKVHSLRPHGLEGHMKLYKGVLHHSGNELPKQLLETIGIYVSMLNQCAYCVEHHYHGLRGLLQDDGRANRIHQALGAEVFDLEFDEREQAILAYVKKLTRRPRSIERSDLDALRDSGMTDGQILEVNQVASYFAYANRTVLGLGCDTDGDVLGLSPSDTDDPDNWTHK